MKRILTTALITAAIAALTPPLASASQRPKDVDAEWACEHGDTQAVVYVKVDNPSADGTFLQAPAEAKIVVISLHPRRTLMNEKIEVAFTKFARGSASIQGPGIFVGDLLGNPQHITNKNGEVVYQGSAKSCLN